MHPDFASLEFARFNPEGNDVADDKNKAATANTATAAPAPAPSEDVPWLGNLFGGLNFFGGSAAPAVEAPATEEKPAPAAPEKPAPAAPKGARPVVVNVYGAKTGKPKTKAKEDGAK